MAGARSRLGILFTEQRNEQKSVSNTPLQHSLRDLASGLCHASNGMRKISSMHDFSCDGNNAIEPQIIFQAGLTAVSPLPGMTL